MEFIIASCKNLNVSDKELFDPLSQVYVQAGFTSAEIAKSISDPVN